MIGWLNPGALAALALIAGPVIVHLLRTRRAQRIQFPTLRFVAPARTAAVRLHLPSDPLLLLVRVAIVLAAVLAAAQPVLVTPGRVRAWNARVARAVVVDSSESMGFAGPGGTAAAAAAAEAAEGEQATAQRALRLDAPILRDAVVRAADWLSATPPARRELVVISNFRHGALGAGDLASLPPEVGVRLVRAGADVAERVVSGAQLMGASGVPARVQQIDLTGAQTGVRLKSGPAPRANPAQAVGVSSDQSSPTGLRVIAAGANPAAIEGLLRALANAGTPAPAPDQPIVCQFGEDAVAGASPAAIGPASPRWMIPTVLRLRQDEVLAREARRGSSVALAPSGLWTVVTSDSQGRPVVQVAARGAELQVQIGAALDSLFGAVAVRAVLTARAGDAARPQMEILRTEPRELGSWARAPGEVGRDAWRGAERSDARWLWIVALCLCGIEHRVRRSGALPGVGARDAA